jgi:predicted anti-sigma-YlaC factor YlaD
LSALLDGEEPPVAVAELEQHLPACPSCRSWHEGAHVVTRRIRLAPALAAPSPSEELMAAVTAHAGGGRWHLPALTKARIGLVAVGAVQLGLTVPQLILGSDHEAPIHVAHEMGSFDAALAIGFLVAAWQPLRARGMHILVGAAAFLLVLTALVDLSTGRTSPADETPHLLAVTGWMLLYRTATLTPMRGEPERSHAEFPRPRQAVGSVPLVWEDIEQHDATGSRQSPAVEHAAAAG